MMTILSCVEEILEKHSFLLTEPGQTKREIDQNYASICNSFEEWLNNVVTGIIN